jgi:Zn-dependent peptidase ImmA (M78 family)
MTRLRLKQPGRPSPGFYEELDVPPPTENLPVAPLGPLLERLHVAHEELPGLTAVRAEAFLQGRGVVGEDGLGLCGDTNEKLAGFLYASGRAARLFVNADDPVVRRRFSIAHELGHYVLHFRPRLLRWREALEAGEEVAPVLCDAFALPDGPEDEDEEETNNDGADYDRQEREADAFAAALLLPADVIAARAGALQPDFAGESLAERLAMDLLVSRQAMRRRLRALGYLAPKEA